MKTFLIDVRNCVEMSRFEPFFYEAIKQERLAVFPRSLDSLDELDQVKTWLMGEINRRAFSVDRALLIFFLPRDLTRALAPEDYEIIVKLHIYQRIVRHLDGSFRYVCFFLDRASRDKTDDRAYFQIDRTNLALCSENKALQGSFLPEALGVPAGQDPYPALARAIDALTDEAAKAFFRSALDEVRAAVFSDSPLSAEEMDVRYPGFLGFCKGKLNVVSDFRTAFNGDDQGTRIRELLKIVRYVCSSLDSFQCDNNELSQAINMFISRDAFDRFRVDYEEEKRLIATYRDRLMTAKACPKDEGAALNGACANEIHCGDNLEEQTEAALRESGLSSLLTVQEVDYATFDLSGEVFRRLDRFVSRMDEVMREKCGAVCDEYYTQREQISPRRERFEGVDYTDGEIKRLREGAKKLNKYETRVRPGYSAELCLRQNLERLDGQLHWTGERLSRCRIIPFLITLGFALVSVAAVYLGIQFSIFRSDHTWLVFLGYLFVTGAVFTLSFRATKKYYLNCAKKVLDETRKLLEAFVDHFRKQLVEFQNNINREMDFAITWNEVNQQTCLRGSKRDQENRAIWHKKKIDALLQGLLVFDSFVSGTNPERETAVPSIDLEHDAIHNDFYQMRLF